MSHQIKDTCNPYQTKTHQKCTCDYVRKLYDVSNVKVAIETIKRQTDYVRYCEDIDINLHLQCLRDLSDYCKENYIHLVIAEQEQK